MDKIVNEILVVESEFPYTRSSECSKDQLRDMRAEFIKSCIKEASSITLTGIVTGIRPEDYEEKNIQIKI